MGGWSEYALAMGLFLLSHRIPAAPRLKSRAEAVLGRGGYVALFSLISTGLLIWVIAAAGRAPFVELWGQAGWQRWVVNLAMPGAVGLAVFGIAAPNPFAFEGRADGFDPDRPGIAGVTRQPLLWALALWSGAHLLANGDLAHVILFGMFLVFSLAGMAMVERRRLATMGAGAWQNMTRNTGVFPFAAMGSGRWRPAGRPSTPRLILWLAVWAGIWMLHAPVIGVSPVP
jgi:uncharacterized membrane protein